MGLLDRLARRVPAVAGRGTEDTAEAAVRARWLARWDAYWEPAATGGPPVRGEVLPFWRPAAAVDEATRAAWASVAWRITLGVELAAHLEPVLAPDRLMVGCCAESPALARALRAAIAAEGVAAVGAGAHPGAAGCDVLLPCWPGMPDGEADQVVLAAVKAAHALLCAMP